MAANMTLHSDSTDTSEVDTPGLAALAAYTPRFLDPHRWVAWRRPVIDAVGLAAPHNGEMARALAGDVCELVVAAEAEPSIPIVDLLSDGNISLLCHARRRRGMSAAGIRRTSSALLGLQRIVAGFDTPSGPGPSPSVASQDRLPTLARMCRGEDRAAAAAAQVVVADLLHPRAEPWPRPLGDNAWRWTMRRAQSHGKTGSRWAWGELKNEAIRRLFNLPVPAIELIADLELGHHRLERLVRGVPLDGQRVASETRGSGTLEAPHQWEIVNVKRVAAGTSSPSKSTGRISRAQVKRLTAAVQDVRDADPDPLPEELEDILMTWVPSPQILDLGRWLGVRDLTHEIMRRSHVRGETSFRKHLRLVARFLAWCIEEGYSRQIDEVMTGAVIDRYLTSALADKPRSRQATERADLRQIAMRVSMSPEAPAPRLPISHWEVKPPYPDREQRAILRRIELVVDERTQRRIKTAAALGLGAGLDTRDIKSLTRADIDDRAQDGILISVRGDRPRQVWLRQDSEQMLREGISHLTANEHVLGRPRMHKDAVVDLYDAIQPMGDGPRVQQGRLRNTWIGILMTEPIPLRTLLAAAGLSSARTLTDIAQFIAPVTPPVQTLRGAA